MGNGIPLSRRRPYLGPGFLAALVFLLVINGATGTLLFARAEVDPLVPADAIVVLSGVHDGREAYGLDLAARGYGRVVLISVPDKPLDSEFAKACAPRADITVICRAASPFTTRGEAMMTQELAKEFGWHRVIVISARYHLPRARKIFNQCFEDSTRDAIMVDVPRSYRFSVAEWQYAFLYQYAGWAKAEIQGPCD